jgi:hypothetical protein
VPASFCGCARTGPFLECLMNNLRLLISKGIEALLGKSFPRRVTAPNGSARWQSSSGRSFDTVEEASRA